jgi:hypothetical protein
MRTNVGRIKRQRDEATAQPGDKKLYICLKIST